MSTSFIGRAAKLFTLKQQDLFTKLEFCSAGPQTLKHQPTFTKLECPKHHLLMHSAAAHPPNGQHQFGKLSHPSPLNE